MKRSLLALATLACAGVLYTLPTASLSSQKSDKAEIKKLQSKNSPVDIVNVKLKGRGMETARPFDADGEWMRELSVELKNVSSREIVYIKVELDFPTDDSGNNLVVLPLEYGRAPQSGDAAPAANPIPPGESVTLTVQGWSVDFLKRKLEEKGGGKALKMKKASLFVSQVWFDKDTAWTLGTTFVRDPSDKDKWNPVEEALEELF